MNNKELIKRLRMATTILPPSNVCIEAANEIELLREQNEYLKANVEMLLREARERDSDG